MAKPKRVIKKTPKRYRKTWDKRVADMVHKGLTIQQQCDQFNISRQSYYDMRRRYPSFDDAIKEAKENFTDDVENQLYKRAMGYEYKEVSEVEIIDEDGEPTGKKKRTTTVKHLPGDPRLIKYILGCRCPTEWQEKQEVDVNVKSIKVIPPEFDQE